MNIVPSVFITKCDCVDSTHVPVILLNDFVGPGVPSDNFFVGRPDNEQVLFVFIRIELDTVTYFFVCETAHTLTRFCIPKLDEPEKHVSL